MAAIKVSDRKNLNPVEIGDLKDGETVRPCGALSEGLGAGARRWFALVEFGISAFAWVCVYLALRTLAPPSIEWWQASALGGTAMMLVRIWWNRGALG